MTANAFSHIVDDVLIPYCSETTEQDLRKVVEMWEHIYGTSREDVVNELTNEFKKEFTQFWTQQHTSLIEKSQEIYDRIDSAGQQAVQLEKALGLKPEVSNLNENNKPLVEIEEQLLTVLDTYNELKKNRLEEYSKLSKKEEELCLVLDMKTSKNLNVIRDGKPETDHTVYVPNTEDMVALQNRVQKLESLKEQLEYDVEDSKCELRQLLEECKIIPLLKEERFALNEADLNITKSTLKLLRESINRYQKKKAEMIAESDHLREQISRLSKKMSKDPNELEQFLSAHSGFTQPTMDKLKLELAMLKDERKHNMKDLIIRCREIMTEWWDKCCYTEAQRQEFKPYKANRWTEDVLEFHELEIENLENFYNENKKIFQLAKQHEDLWERLLHLEEQSNNKDRLFKNRGGCLLQEEKERKLIQKRVPAIKADLMALLIKYKEETGKDFLHYGEPLLDTIEQKEMQREMYKNQEKLYRKAVNAENVMIESRLGAYPVTGNKRKALTPANSNKVKLKRIESTTVSSSSSKSTTSGGVRTMVVREEDHAHGSTHLMVPTPKYGARSNKLPAASTPKNGSLSYESFQEHIERSKYLPLNSTRNIDQQRVLRSKNLNQTRIMSDKKITPYKTPTTLAKTLTKTPSKTPSRTPSKTPSKIPFRIPTGSKIPSHVPPVSPRKPITSKTKLPIIF